MIALRDILVAYGVKNPDWNKFKRKNEETEDGSKKIGSFSPKENKR